MKITSLFMGVSLMMIFCHSSFAVERVSVDSSGGEAQGTSSYPSLSANRRFIAFESAASDLVPGDNNGQYDVFVHDRQTGATERVSVDSSGNEAQGSSAFASISADGRFVAFLSQASNLVAGDNNEGFDFFVHDRQTGATERVSVDSNGNEAQASEGYLVSSLSISADGRFVAFQSSASNLVAGDNNNADDIFVHDRQTNTTERASVDSSGAEAQGISRYPSVSADGRFVAFQSLASNLVAGDNNDGGDIFIRDRQTGATERVSVDSNGNEAQATSYTSSISADGRFIAFESRASNLVAGDNNDSSDIFVYDRQTNTTERVSVDSNGNEAAHGGSVSFPSISADGRFIAFESSASNLVTGDNNNAPDIFIHDRQTGKTRRVSVNSNGAEVPTEGGGAPSISADGQLVAFASITGALVVGDTNNMSDIFVASYLPPTPYFPQYIIQKKKFSPPPFMQRVPK